MKAFLRPIVGAAFGGDANTALRALSMPAAVRYALSAAGAISLAAFMFFSGKQLVRATPAGTPRARAVIATVIAPWLIGALLSVVLYLPLPSVLILSSLSGSTFWLFAAIGAAFARDTPRRPAALVVRYADLGLVVAAFLMVRVLVDGIRLAP